MWLILLKTVSKWSVWNVGSLTTHSFASDQTKVSKHNILLISGETKLHKQSWGMILLSSVLYWSSSSIKINGLLHFCQIKDYYILTYLEKE